MHTILVVICVFHRLCDSKQSRTFLPEPPFLHEDFVKSGRLKIFSNIYDGESDSVRLKFNLYTYFHTYCMYCIMDLHSYTGLCIVRMYIFTFIYCPMYCMYIFMDLHS